MIKPAGSNGKYKMWECLCSCGSVVVLRGARVAAGEQKTCGKCNPASRINVGDTFGHWTVEGKVVHNGKPMFIVVCKCGESSRAYASSLISGTTRQCRRCSLFDMTESGPMAPFDKVKHYLEATAKRNNRSFEMSDAKIDEVSTSNCYYCGFNPASRLPSGRYQGFDRVDNTLGYTDENVVPCCKLCNRAKNAMPIELFYEWIERLKAYGSL